MPNYSAEYPPDILDLSDLQDWTPFAGNTRGMLPLMSSFREKAPACACCPSGGSSNGYWEGARLWNLFPSAANPYQNGLKLVLSATKDQVESREYTTQVSQRN